LTRQRDEAFVLGTTELGEADLIVTLLTERHGKVRGVARAARRSRRRFGGLLEPLTRVRASWFGREGRDLQRLDNLDGVRSFAAMQAEPLRQAACAVLAEVASGFSHEGQADPEEFRLLGAVLDALEQDGPPRLLLRYFEYWTLRVHGLLPDLTRCALCGAPLAAARPVRVSRGRGPLCDACPRLADEREAMLGTSDRAFLDAARSLGPAALGRARPPLRAARALETLLRGALEAFAERSFRTYRHFRAAERFPARGDQA
jgi:DNA repair protein RecO (recombination protein O)